MTKAVLEAGSEDRANLAAVVPAPGIGRSGKPACVADGAARPARARKRSCADRGGHRPGFFSHAAGAGGGQAERGTGIGAGSSDRRGAAVPNRLAAGCRPICSTTRWCRTRLTAHCSASAAARFMRGLPVHSKVISATWRKASRSLWRATTPRPVSLEKAAVLVGQGRPTVIGAVGAGRSRGAALARAFADRGVAGHGRAPARSDQASDRPFKRADPHQGPCVAGDQGIVRPGARLDRGGGSARGAA